MGMENGRKADYNVHNLTFLRNNSCPQRIDFDGKQNYFFMMDYYNLLKERKLKKETDGYVVLVGNAKDENNAVARRIMGIYSEKILTYDEQIFETASAETGSTSGMPFLGIIQVYIADYAWKKERKPIHIQQIDSYLEAYKKEIETNINKALAEDDLCHIYRTISSEDFCVVIRTSKISNIYHAALKIMDIKNEFHKRVFFTYTNIGIECVRCERKDSFLSELLFLDLNESVRMKNQDVNFVLRFRIEIKALEEIQALNVDQKSKKGNVERIKIEDINGMIGRYDLVVRLSMDEFMEIYPYLCMNATGEKFKCNNSKNINGRFSKILVEKMEDGSIQTINTRIIVDIYAKEREGNTLSVPLLDDDDIDKIKSRTISVMKLYNKFKSDHDNKFLAYKYHYVELIRMLDSLIYSYENLAYEIDTHINWFIFSQYLEKVFKSMNAYMEAFDKNIEPRAIEKFLNEFQAFISAFDIYLRLLQGINQNTIQSPRYDISTPIDGQKFLMAYSEFIDSVHEEYRKDQWDKRGELACSEKRRTENTIIYPDLTIKNLELMEAFCYDNVKISNVNYENPAMLICKIPMFEYFERPYDLIPLILHEISHHMLILKREVRNEFLIRRVFERIAAEAIKQVQNRYIKKEYSNRVDALTKAMEQGLADALVEIFKENCISYKEYVFLHLSKRIESFVYSYFEDEEQKQNNRPMSNSVEKIIEDYEILISEVYENDETALKKFQSIDLSSMVESGDRKAIYTCNDKLMKFTRELLLQINEITIKYGKPIALDEIMSKNNQELDEYLLHWAKEKEADILKTENIDERKQLLKNYLVLIKRTVLILTEAVCIRENRSSSFRRKLAERFGKMAKKKVQEFWNEYYYIYDEDKVKKNVFWEFEQEERAQEHYIEAMECIDPNRIMDAIKFSVVNYREVCADIIMCRWLGLSSFGYFRKAVALAPRMQGYAEQIQYEAMLWERLIDVLSVLSTKENPNSCTGSEVKEIDLSDLQKNIWQYIEETLKYTKERIWKTMDMEIGEESDKEQAQKALGMFFQKVKETIEVFEDCVLKNKKIVWEGSIWDRLYNHKKGFGLIDNYFPYFYKEANIFKRLYDMLNTYNYIQVGNKLHIKSEIYEHVLSIYDNATKAGELHKVVSEVADFYNDPTSEKKSNAQKLGDMLLFVQDYYYYNRIKKVEEE